MEKIELRDKWVDYLLIIYEKKIISPFDISREVGVYGSYSHVHNIVNLMVRAGLVGKKVRDGRTNDVFLTETGLELARHLKLAKTILSKL